MTMAQPDGGPARDARMTVFRDIEVVPATAPPSHSAIFHGGPIWPDFARQHGPRHLRHGTPADREPAPMAGPEPLDEPAVWAGWAIRHFGHLVAEQLTRLLVSLRERPADRYLFGIAPAVAPDALPAYFGALLDWYGLDAGQVSYVRKPLKVRELRVADAAESLPDGGPSAAYLDLVEANQRRNAVAPIPDDLLYVSRVGQLGEGVGGHAGETYLVDLLRQLGVSVMNPARTSLREQVARYAGARTIVFAEGSAQHGRQLIGRVADQSIVVLVRRPGERLAKAMLTPRCARLRYAEVTRRTLVPQRLDGEAAPMMAAGLYDVPALIGAFRGLGVDLGAVWDRQAFQGHQRRQIGNWLRALARPHAEVSMAATGAALRGDLRHDALDDLLDLPADMPHTPIDDIRRHPEED